MQDSYPPEIGVARVMFNLGLLLSEMGGRQHKLTHANRRLVDRWVRVVRPILRQLPADFWEEQTADFETAVDVWETAIRARDLTWVRHLRAALIDCGQRWLCDRWNRQLPVGEQLLLFYEQAA